MKKVYNNILVFSDLHIPGHHKDLLPFLSWVKKTYGPFDKVVLNGDAVDNHAISNFDSEPDALGDDPEIKACRREIKKLGSLFPELDFIIGNHEDRHYRAGGKSLARFVKLEELYKFPKRWRTMSDIVLDLPTEQKVHIQHSIAGSTEAMIKESITCAVQSHLHALFNISYKRIATGEVWGATIGCLVDRNHSYAKYGAKYLRKPILGCLVIKDGLPHLVKLVEAENGRWVGEPKPAAEVEAKKTTNEKVCDHCGSTRLQNKGLSVDREGNPYRRFTCRVCRISKRIYLGG